MPRRRQRSREDAWRSASSRPASLVSNLDFVESIFGNGGDPYLPENDAALDALHWTGHTGCVILAPHLVGHEEEGSRPAARRARPPNASGATACAGRDADEPYNDGGAFKITCRDRRGVMVTIIADNYYGYCKKEVKTQISFAANLFGTLRGGARRRRDRLPHLRARPGVLRRPHRQPEEGRLRGRHARCSAIMVEQQPEGYAIDRRYPDIFYVPEDADFNVRDGFVTLAHAATRRAR